MSDAALADDQSRRVQRGSTISPEDELAAARRSLETKTREADKLRSTNVDLSNQVVESAAIAANAEIARINERETSLTTAINSAMTEQSSAESAKRAAREAGNIDAELAADKAFSKATVRLEALNIEKTRFDGNKPRLMEEAKRKAEAPKTAAPNRAPEAQRWLDEHPRFESDPVYKADALEAHRAAVAAGISTNSSDYSRYLNTRLERLYGKNHGQPEGARHQERDSDMNRDRGTSSATPPSRDTDASFSQQVDGSTLRLSRDASGKPQLSGQIPGSWRDAARYCGMDEVAYAIDQMVIAEEAKSGKNSLMTSSDGMFYKV